MRVSTHHMGRQRHDSPARLARPGLPPGGCGAWIRSHRVQASKDPSGSDRNPAPACAARPGARLRRDRGTSPNRASAALATSRLTGLSSATSTRDPVKHGRASPCSSPVPLISLSESPRCRRSNSARASLDRDGEPHQGIGIATPDTDLAILVTDRGQRDDRTCIGGARAEGLQCRRFHDPEAHAAQLLLRACSGPISTRAKPLSVASAPRL